MSECPKKLPNTIAVACAASVPRRPIRSGDPQRHSGICKMRELRILAKARKHTTSCVGDHKLEDAIAYGVGEKTAFRSAAVLKHIVLQLTERPHQAADKPLLQPCCDRGVLGMLSPLLPSEPVRIPSFRVYAGQGKRPGAIAWASAADRSITERTLKLVEDGWFDHDAAVRVRESPGRHREFNQRSNPSRPLERDPSHLRQSASDRLPQEIVNCLETRDHPPRCSFVQIAPAYSSRLRRNGSRSFCHLSLSDSSSIKGSSVVEFISNATVLYVFLNLRTSPLA